MLASGELDGLVKKAQSGSRAAMQQLVEHHMGAIMARVTKYKRTNMYDDARAYALLGFMQGVYHYRSGHGAQLASYATYWVDMEVQKYMRAQCFRGTAKTDDRGAKRSVALRAIWDRSWNTEEYLEKAKARFPDMSDDSLLAVRHMFEQRVEHMVCVNNDDPSPKADDLLESADEREMVRRSLEALPERQRAVVQWTVLEGMTLEAVGEHLGLTKERVRQIREEALAQMRKTCQKAA